MPSHTIAITVEQRSIMEHTARHAANGLFCGDSPNMQALVTLGLMEYAGKVSWCPDKYFRLTTAGRDFLRGTQQQGGAK